MIITTNEQRELLLSAGTRLREILDATAKKIQKGVTPFELNEFAHHMVVEKGDTPSFLNYVPAGMHKGFPATLSVSVNDEIVHGIPTQDKPALTDGDIVTIDCGLEREGVFVDAACTIIVGEGDTKLEKLIEATKKALVCAIAAARAGNTTGDIGYAVETVAHEYKFTTPPELGGHGVGGAVHEAPFVPNVGDPGKGEKLVEGQVLALEPIFLTGEDPRIHVADDGFTCLSVDDSLSAQFEHTIIVTNDTPIIVTGSHW